MAYRGAFQINNSTGSDSAASGIGPPNAVTGYYAYTSSYSSTINLSYDSPNLSGVQAGDCIYIPSLSGYSERYFLEIASVDNTAKTVTVTTTIQNSLYGTSWYIGGKRAFGNSAAGRSIFDQLNTYGVEDISVEFQYTGTDYVQSGSSPIYGNARVFGTGSQMPRLQITGNNAEYFTPVSSRNDSYTTSFENLWFVGDNSSSTTTAINASTGATFVDSCKFGDESHTTAGLLYGIRAGYSSIDVGVNNSEFINTATGVEVSGSTCSACINNCTFANASTVGASLLSTTGRFSVTNCAFSNCTVAIDNRTAKRSHIFNNAITGSGVTGNIAVKLQDDPTVIAGNVFVNNDDCIYATVGNNKRTRATRNYWRGNTAKYTTSTFSDIYNIFDDYDVDLSTDPFVGEINNDLSLDSSQGADTLRDVTTVNTTDQQLTAIRPLKYLDASSSSGGGGGSNVFVIEE